MTVDEAAQVLARMYREAPDGEKVVHIHLFGIQYAEAIRDMSATEVAIRANLPKSYGTEISKGRALARFVIIK